MKADSQLFRGLYAKMHYIREAERVAADHYLDKKVFSMVHFCIGQELAPATMGLITSEEDRFFGNHRSHGHFLAKGGSAFKMYSEMLGKASGCAKGKGGSMHMIDKSVGFMGTSPILSSALPLAAGSAWEQVRSNSKGITVVFTGDGATEEGNFYETLNLASLWRLPLLIVVEDNLYSINSKIDVRRPINFSMERLVLSLGAAYFHADSADPLDAFSILSDATALVRTSRAPALVTVKAYRHLAHSTPLKDDHLSYRQEDIELARKKADPLETLRETLLDFGLGLDELEELEEANASSVLRSLEEALAQPAPDPSDAYRNIYV